MNEVNKARIMIISWSWSERDGVFPAEGYEEWTVENASTDVFIMINEKHTDCNTLIYHFLEKYATQSIQIFIHNKTSNHLPDAEWIAIIKKHTSNLSPPQSIQFFSFGGGHHYLYLSANEHAILGSSGTLKIVYPNKETHSAIQEETKRIVKKKHFDNVWYYYLYQWKPRLGKLWRRLLGHLLDKPSEEVFTPRDMVQHLEAMEDGQIVVAQLSSICRPTNTQRLKLLEDREQNSPYRFSFKEAQLSLKNSYGKAVENHYEHLKKSIDARFFEGVEPISSAALRDELNECFSQLLNVLPGHYIER